MDATRQVPVVCKLSVNSKGTILEADGNCDLIFACQVYKGINFFELMASYNYKYLQDKFEEDPLIGMAKNPKQKIVIRFSVNGLDALSLPIIVTAKVIFTKRHKKIDCEDNFIHATIFARRSSEKSSKQLQLKIQQGIEEAQKIY